MARIFYFTLQDEQTKDEKLDWFANIKIEHISFEQITPDKKANWVNQTDNNFDDLLPLVDKDVKAGKSEEAVFKLFSYGFDTKRDEWVYDFNLENLKRKVSFFSQAYNQSIFIDNPSSQSEIKWSRNLKRDAQRGLNLNLSDTDIICSEYRPCTSKFLYWHKTLISETFQWFNMPLHSNYFIAFSGIASSKAFQLFISDVPVCGDFLEKTQCLPLYRYDEKGDRVENITDWALERFREHYLPSPPAPLPQERGVREPSPPAPLPQERGARAGLGFVQENGTDADLVRLVGARREIPEVLLQKAKELRQKQTPAEQMLWQCLRANQLHGAKFRRQHNIGQYIVDFYCHTAKLVIELDGGIHELQKDRDSDRDTYLKANGLQVLRLQNEEITQNLPQVLQTITNHLSLFLPSPEGEGQGVRAKTPAGEGLGVRAETPARETITKLDIFHYTYAVLHHPAYRTKYELNLKREFPRLPFYEDFHQWVSWGKALMDLHLNYETIEPYGLKRVEIATKDSPKAKLKADKTNGVISLDDNTQLTDVPAIAWEYKLGNRSALEWILDQYKEKKPKDPTIAKLFNAYKFADYKEQVVDLLQRVCTVSVKTMEIIQQMPTT